MPEVLGQRSLMVPHCGAHTHMCCDWEYRAVGTVSGVNNHASSKAEWELRRSLVRSHFH